MVLIRSGTCFWCGESFNVYGTGSPPMGCDRCDRARARCAELGEGEVAEQWIAFVFGPETLKRGRLRPWILRKDQS